jgi:hypothetical protein
VSGLYCVVGCVCGCQFEHQFCEVVDHLWRSNCCCHKVFVSVPCCGVCDHLSFVNFVRLPSLCSAVMVVVH